MSSENMGKFEESKKNGVMSSANDKGKAVVKKKTGTKKSKKDDD